MGMLDLFSALLYPPTCLFCGRDLVQPTVPAACRRCVSTLATPGPTCARCGEPGTESPRHRCRVLPPPFGTASSAFVYRVRGGPDHLRRAILRWKYRGDHPLGAALAHLFAGRFEPRTTAGAWIVPVPLHPRRLARRGFNQAAVLAAALARRHSRPLRHVLVRTGFAGSQTRLGRPSRSRNVAGAFSVRHGCELEGCRVVLIDDVLTSGATAAECARVLLERGAARVDVRTLARATAGGIGFLPNAPPLPSPAATDSLRLA